MNTKIVVFGSFVVDVTCFANKLPIAGQTVSGNLFKMGPGGKGSNQAVAAHRAGADVTLITKIGTDSFSDIAMDFYHSEGMDTSYIFRDSNQSTGAALIEVNEKTAENRIIVVPGACLSITEADVEKCRSLIEQASFILFQHEINMDAQLAAIDIAYNARAKIILNPAPAEPIPADVLRKIEIITPNETEAQQLTGVEISDISGAEKAAAIFHELGVKCVVITLGSKGVFCSNASQSEFIPSYVVDAVDSTGAGDAFNGALITALSEGHDIFTAVRFANAAGALSVTKIGTAPAMPMRSEINDMLTKTMQCYKKDF